MEFNVPKFIVTAFLLSIVATAATPTQAASDEAFPIAGTYLENRVCKGDGSDAAAPRIKITATEINSSFGLCTLGDKRRTGNKITAQITCKDPGGGALTSDISFTIRDDKTLDFADQYETYKAVLYKCPD
jgi:hypothetical protein